MKTGKNFKISKQTKALLSLMTFDDSHQRGAFKRMMIQAQLASGTKVSSKEAS